MRNLLLDFVAAVQVVQAALEEDAAGVVDLGDALGREAAAPQQAEAGDAPAPQADDVPELRVTGVTLTPMRFISLATGQRVFEGGLLPGGYVLESIDVKELKLRKDGRIIVYRLRGSNE